ncbi:unnamed protein product, partial [Oppiella nova]
MVISTLFYRYTDWQDFKRGIKVMKQKHIRNPLGFYFQANIHGWDEYDGSETANYIADHFNWHKCTHEQYFFLVWHRMYLYFFERILRKASGNPNLTVPYWDYSDPRAREIPQPFRIPANDVTNPLYTSHRCRHINEGKPLNAEITDPYPSLNSRFFTANKSNVLNVCHSIGGGRLETPVFLSDREGLLERLPHDRIHVYVGGPGGFMADLCNAAKDPVFWIHHCMIDRIWESWLQNGGQNIREAQYLNTSFKFYNENGDLGNYYVKDFLNMSRLGYRYDSLLNNTDRIWESWIAAGGANIIDDQYLNTTFNFFDETGQLGAYRVGDFLSAKALGYRYDYLIKSAPVEVTHNEAPKLYVPIDEKEGLNINYYKRFITLTMKPQWSVFFEKYVTGEFDGLDIRFTLQFDL